MHDEGPYHTETSLLISISNQWTGFNMIGIFVMKELKRDQNRQNFSLQRYSLNNLRYFKKANFRNKKEPAPTLN